MIIRAQASLIQVSTGPGYWQSWDKENQSLLERDREGCWEKSRMTSDSTFPRALPVPVEQELILLVPALAAGCGRKLLDRAGCGHPVTVELARGLQLEYGR
jgi:hypothetical protein